MSHIYQSNLCLAGCGKKVVNVSGVCRNCRKSKCRECGKVFNWKLMKKDLCLACEKKYTSTNLKYVAQMRAI